MRDIDDILHWLYGLQFFGMKLGLGNTDALCKFLGDPQKKYPVVHIAGTNGKGSTSAMIASVLQESGLKVALYTSPHLVQFNERIRVNGARISDAQIVEYAHALRPLVDDLRGTFFEATTAMAFKYFADQQVDIAVIETGLGGRLDSTNVVKPVLSVITSIGFDHMEHLGTTIESITREKAGIIKPRVPVIVGARLPEAKEILNDTARVERSSLRYAYEIVATHVNNMTLDGMDIDVRGELHEIKSIASPFIGMHQAENIENAFAALEALEGELKHPLDDDTISRGVANAAKNSGLRCRLETIHRNPRIVCDVAHNPPAFDRVVETLEQIGVGRSTWVLGIMRDKDYTAVLQRVAPLCATMYCVAPKNERALPAGELTRAAVAVGIDARDAGSVERGVNDALAEARGEAIFVAGSHFVAGEVLSAM